MLNQIFDNEKFAQFYRSDLPRVCFWIGIFGAIIYFVLFLMPVLSGAGVDVSLLLPFKSDFLASGLLVLLSFALVKKSPAIPTLFMVLGLLVAGQYVRIAGAGSGQFGPIPVSLIGNLIVTLELMVIVVFYLYSVKQLRDVDRS